MKKNKLVVSYEYDFELLGITSSVKEYKLAWAINNSFNFKLKKNEDLVIDFNGGKKIIISNYIFKTQHSSFRLFKNKSFDSASDSPNYLIPELKNFDFVISINGFEDTYLVEEFIQKLRAIAEVMYVQKIDIMGLKSKDNLIF